jgi:hypothetical protein
MFAIYEKRPVLMTEQQARSTFALYFLDLQADAKNAGAPPVSKTHEWKMSILIWLEEGRVPSGAIQWKCPRSLKI